LDMRVVRKSRQDSRQLLDSVRLPGNTKFDLTRPDVPELDTHRAAQPACFRGGLPQSLSRVVCEYPA
jgi:hypothetical protein